MSWCNELIRYGAPVHPLNKLLYAWALLFPLTKCETFEAAANGFGRLRRSWTRAIFLASYVVDRLSMPLAQEPGLESYFDRLHADAAAARRQTDLSQGPDMPVLPFPFRAPSLATAQRRLNKSRTLLGRDLTPKAWFYGSLRAGRTFDLNRWFPYRPNCWDTHGVTMEPPFSVSYVTEAFLDCVNDAWSMVFSELCCILVAGWVYKFCKEKVFCYLPHTVREWLAALPHDLF